MDKTKRIFQRELDLRYFLNNQRILMTAIQGLLSGRQQTFVDQISSFVVHESTEAERSGSDDDFKNEMRHQYTGHIWKMLTSTRNMVDQRLIDAYKIQEINRKGLSSFESIKGDNKNR